MLSGTPSDSSTPLDNPVNLAVSLPLSPLLIVILHIAERRLICQGSYRARTVGLASAEDDLRILVGVTLIVAREVKVNIRLLVPLESKERLERNIESVLNQLLPADRAVLIRHIPSAAAGKCPHFFRLEVAVMAMLAVVMRAQGIYLGNSRHRRHEGRAYGATGSNQIAILIGLPHQFLRYNVHHREAVGDDGIQFPLQTLRNNRRQFFPIHGVSLIVADLPQRLIGIGNDRRALVRPDRRNLFCHIRNLAGIVYHDLFCFCRTQIFKLF